MVFVTPRHPGPERERGGAEESVSCNVSGRGGRKFIVALDEGSIDVRWREHGDVSIIRDVSCREGTTTNKEEFRKMRIVWNVEICLLCYMQISDVQMNSSPMHACVLIIIIPYVPLCSATNIHKVKTIDTTLE